LGAFLISTTWFGICDTISNVRAIVKVRRCGGCAIVTLPLGVLAATGWRHGDYVLMTATKAKVTLELEKQANEEETDVRRTA
jgi:hypothetical protein